MTEAGDMRDRGPVPWPANPEWLHVLFEHSPEGLLLTAPDGRILMANPAACRLFGLTEAELIAAGRAGVTDASDPRHEQPRAERRRTGVGRGTVRLKRGDGSVFPAEVTSAIFHGQDGQEYTSMLIRDITDRLQSEEALRDSQAHLRALADATFEGLVVHERGTIADANEAFARMAGFASPAEVVGQSMFDLVAPEDRQRIVDAVEAGREASSEITLERRDGTRFPVEARGRSIVYAGRAMRVVAIRDLTERKRAEREQEARQRIAALRVDVAAAMYEHQQLDQILAACADLIVHYTDAAFARIWTLDPVEPVLVLQASAGRYTHLDGPHGRVPVGQFKIGRIAANRRPHLSNEVPTDPEVDDHEWARREGMVAFAGYPMIVGDELIGVIALFARHRLSEAVLADLAAVADLLGMGIRRHHAEADVATERAKLASILAEMSDGLILLDEIQRIQYANRRAGELLGVDPAELINRTGAEAFALVREKFADPAITWADWTAALVRLPEEPSFEITMLQPRHRDLILRLFPVSKAGNSAGFGILIWDVTAERDTSRLKDELISVVSHELRTPLASVVGFAELLLSREWSAETYREYLTVILTEGRRLTGLLNDFLDLQRLESGVHRVEVRPIDLRPLVEQAVAALGDDPAHPTVLDIPHPLPAVRADPDRVLQILGNLLSNARKYSPDGGEITLAARPGQGLVEITVRDPGLGLSAEAIPQLFGKFYRFDNSDQREIRGTGLGLAIVKGLVESQGGHTWAESPGPGQGSTFGFTLPIA